MLLLYQINRRRFYHAFGFENIYDYAMERFSFCHSKTRTLLYFARKLTQLPRLTAALAAGKIGWTKAALLHGSDNPNGISKLRFWGKNAESMESVSYQHSCNNAAKACGFK